MYKTKQGFMSTKSREEQDEFLPPGLNVFLNPWNEWLDAGAGIWRRTLLVPAVNGSENTKKLQNSLSRTRYEERGN
jgi:hypothetical protein